VAFTERQLPRRRNALFFADYSRNCIWTMFPDAQGDPDPATRATFAGGAPGPVDLQIGPNGDLFYVNFSNGDVRRIQATGTNQPPIASLQANPTYGALPLTVQFNGAASSDPEGGAVTYAWDLNGDGQYNDSTATAPSYTYNTAGNVTVGLRVTDPQGGIGNATTVIAAGNTPPVVTINTPSSSTPWNVGDLIPFSGSATDAQDGPLAPAALTWSVIIHHCPSNCHLHPLQSFVGVASGSFNAPDHEYPSYLELQLTATDSKGLSSTTSVLLYPNTVTLSFGSSPVSGLSLSVGSRSAITVRGTSSSGPRRRSTRRRHRGRAERPQFVSWSDGGARTHTFVAPSAAAQYVATFEPVQGGVCGDGRLDPGEECDDGNTASGDCCSSVCQIEDSSPCDLTQFGTIMALVTSPSGGGNRNIEILRDGDTPPVGNQDSNRQYDTYDGSNPASFARIGRLLVHGTAGVQPHRLPGGKDFFDGGWFTSLTAQVRQDGTFWTPVAALSITPAYPGIDNGVSSRRTRLDFSPVVGDAIRLLMVSGGSGHFRSFGGLRVRAASWSALNPPTPTPTPPPNRRRRRRRRRRATRGDSDPNGHANRHARRPLRRRDAAANTATRTSHRTVTATAAAGVCAATGARRRRDLRRHGNQRQRRSLRELPDRAAAPCNLTRPERSSPLVTNPTGGGNRKIQIIRDGDKPRSRHRSNRSSTTMTATAASDLAS
jgi:cysteine-rich repeat protein